MLKQTLEQKLLQKLSPQQILLMKLLQVPITSLEQRIKQEIEENPALEDENDYEEENDDKIEDEYENDEAEVDKTEDNEFDINDYYDEEDYDNTHDYKLKSNNQSADDEFREIPYASGVSFHESLVEQLGMLTDNEREYNIAALIVGNLEDSGYLLRELESIVDDLAFTQNIVSNENEVKDVLLKVVQNLDPPGIGARNLQECLLIQINRSEIKDKKIKNLAVEIIENYFNEFIKKHYQKIISKIDCNEKELKEVFAEILKLNPKPGGVSTDKNSNNYLIPDFYISNIGGKLNLSLHSNNSPELKLSRTYKNMFEQLSSESEKQKPQQKEALIFVKQKIDSAKSFIDAIEQRKNTLYIVMEAIMNYQKEYFLTGDETKLKPMILKDISDIVTLDISTISRVANSKYVQTQFGTFLIKNFFSESMTMESGEEVSSREVKKILIECIENEDKEKPLTDDQLMNVLKEKGYNIARRTVAKYREMLNISVARLRKEL